MIHRDNQLCLTNKTLSAGLQGSTEGQGSETRMLLKRGSGNSIKIRKQKHVLEMRCISSITFYLRHFPFHKVAYHCNINIFGNIFAPFLSQHMGSLVYLSPSLSSPTFLFPAIALQFASKEMEELFNYNII